jgi:hypothetical protein
MAEKWKEKKKEKELIHELEHKERVWAKLDDEAKSAIDRVWAEIADEEDYELLRDEDIHTSGGK